MSATGQRRDPFPVYCFRVEIDQIDGAAAFFRKVSGLKNESEVVDVLEGGQNEFTHRLIGPTKWTNLVFERGFSRSNELIQWREEWLFGSKQRRNGKIVQLDTKLNPVCTWWFQDGWPCKWELSELDASKNELTMETLEIAHHGLLCESPRSRAVSVPAARSGPKPGTSAPRSPGSGSKPGTSASRSPGSQPAVPVIAQQTASVGISAGAGNQGKRPDVKLQKHYVDVEAARTEHQHGLDNPQGKTEDQIRHHKRRVTEAKGEKAAADYMVAHRPGYRMKLGFKPGPGFDQVWFKRGEGGKLEEIVIVEAKGPDQELKQTKKMGMQMSREWVAKRAEIMSRSKNRARKKLGIMILDAIENGHPPTLTGEVVTATHQGGYTVMPKGLSTYEGIYN